MNYLEGVRIIDFSQLLPGPFCTMLLADLGSEVIKIERPKLGEPSRNMMPGIFWAGNHSKKSITLNLKSYEAVEIAKQLIRDADVVVEGFRPGVMDRLGLGYNHVKAVNPEIIYCSISGYGQTGIYRNVPGHDINYQAIAGSLEIPGDIEFPPVRAGIPMGDLSASMYAALTIVAALNRKNQTGEGDYLDVSITDSLFSWTITRLGEMAKNGKVPIGSIDYEHLSPINKSFETKDGSKIALGLVEEKFWIKFCEVAGVTDWLIDSRFNKPEERRKNSDFVLKCMKDLLKKRTFEEWKSLLEGTDIPWTKVNLPGDLLTDLYLNERGLWKQVDEQGGKQVKYPVHVESKAIVDPLAPPELGQHTNEVLSSLGYSMKEIEAFKKSGVI